MTTTCFDHSRGLLFAGSYDRSVKAIDFKTGEVDRSFIASAEAIKCMVIFDKWLFFAGDDPVIRSFDLTSGESKTFEGHKSWILCLLTYTTHNPDGSTRS